VITRPKRLQWMATSRRWKRTVGVDPLSQRKRSPTPKDPGNDDTALDRTGSPIAERLVPRAATPIQGAAPGRQPG
jgi:hypothetical protein